MAVTWAASAPHATAQKEVQQAGLGSGYGASNPAAYITLKWPGPQRAVLTKLTATGTYTVGGDAIDPAVFGLREIFAGFIVASATANVNPVPTNSAGVPTILATTSTAPKVKVFQASAESGAVTMTGDVFHVVLVGI